MNESEQDSEVTFGRVTMEQSKVIPEAGKTLTLSFKNEPGKSQL